LDLTRQRWHDISPPITPAIAVFPGDTPFTRDVALSFAAGHNLELSRIQTTVHLGAHVDAPSHYHPQGVAIDQRNLSRYLGMCEVRSALVPPRTRLTPAHLDHAPLRAPRLLLRTGTFLQPNVWTNDFAALSPELVDWLGAQGAVLVGIDTPSVDLADDAVLLSHAAIFRNDLAVLEGIVLEDVPDGVYLLVALPLPLVGADASPVRAILVEQ
jgi:arylformamidase